MTKILPEVTQPWRRKIDRCHRPPQARGETGYREYRACLRWEFGFTCAFCLSHESDLMRATTEGWAVMQVEHFEPKTRNPGRINDYENCFYICRLCNTARSNAPNRDAQGREMLNPCDAVWQDHFEIADDEIRPRKDLDQNAVLTSERYDFGDRRKVRLRRVRRELILERLGYLEDASLLMADLYDDIGAGGPSKVKHVDMIELLDRQRMSAYKDLLQYAAVPSDPSDSPLSCSCGPGHSHTLPRVLDEQMIDLSEILDTETGRRRPQ